MTILVQLLSFVRGLAKELSDEAAYQRHLRAQRYRIRLKNGGSFRTRASGANIARENAAEASIYSSSPLRRILSTTSSTALIAFTSCTRTICAPLKAHAATAPAVANSVPVWSSCLRKCFLEGPTTMGRSSVPRLDSFAIISAFLFPAFPKTYTGINSNLILLDSAMQRAMSGRLQFAMNGAHHVFERGQFKPCFRSAAHVVDDQAGIPFGDDLWQVRIESQPEESLIISAPCSSAFSATAAL